ncbi:cupin domain-containing protein [Alteromonas sp. CI.11.F.A3]|uniref:cupin domain-containing protein n=1 Tax=Alteromonas sp. CI.11.F.A3 TaxID=3079555 RepID=UPI002941CF44|nr:cupin domain-containing protein [Alteromonas sp. CI.11.F.A3]WOI39285.1 cupin domain-containing protein [Alteromonas sp. CI.11.F.A3]
MKRNLPVVLSVILCALGSVSTALAADTLAVKKNNTDKVISENSFKTQVIPQANAAIDEGEGWIFYSYHNDETFGTSQSLAGMAVIKPGVEIHPPHEHSDEEFLLVTQGSGEWSVEGEVFKANMGDMLYAAPWDEHGVKNTGEVDLIFVVFKWHSKGIAVPTKSAYKK